MRDFEMTNQEIRLECLDRAISFADSQVESSSVTQIISNAKAFERYVKGEK